MSAIGVGITTRWFTASTGVMPWTLVRQSLELPLLRRLDGLFIQPESERLRNLHLSGETALANRSAEQRRPFEFGQPLLISVVWVCFLNRLDGGTSSTEAPTVVSRVRC